MTQQLYKSEANWICGLRDTARPVKFFLIKKKSLQDGYIFKK